MGSNCMKESEWVHGDIESVLKNMCNCTRTEVQKMNRTLLIFEKSEKEAVHFVSYGKEEELLD